MAHRRKGRIGAKAQKKGLLDYLSEGKKAGARATSPVIISDTDPYQFIDSQSLQPDTQPGKKVPTSDVGATSRASREKTQPSTPVQDNSHAPASLRTKAAKRSPRFLSETERLQQEDDENLQRALEASLHEKERQERKRRREELREKGEQSAIMQRLNQKRERINRVIESVGKAVELSAKDLRESQECDLEPDTRDTADDMDCTPPLNTSSGIPSTLTKDSQTKHMKVSVEKLSYSSLNAKKVSSTGTQDISETERVESTIEKHVDGEHLSARESCDRDAAVDKHDLTGISTPPLSRESSVDLLGGDTAAASVVEDSVQDSIVCEENSTAAEQGSDTDVEGHSEKTEVNLDLVSVGALTSSSNLATNTPASGTHSFPFKPVSSPQPTASLDDASIPVPSDVCIPTQQMSIPVPNDTVHIPAHETESTGLEKAAVVTSDSPTGNTEQPSVSKGRNRTGGLSLSRKKRKRISPDSVIIEESVSHPPSEIPMAKRIKTAPAPSNETQDLSIDGVEGVRPKDDNVAPDSNFSNKRVDSSKRLSLKKASKSAIIVEALPEVSNSPDVSSNRKMTPRPKPSAIPHAKKPDLCTLNPSLPRMYCPPDSTPNEHTPLIIHRFNSYFCQLRAAQSKVLTRLKWGEPVKMGSSRQLNLEVGRKTRRSRNAEKSTNSSYLKLPKRKVLNTLEQCAEGEKDEAFENKVFSLSDGPEDVEADGVRSEQSLGGKSLIENAGVPNMQSMKGQRSPEHADAVVESMNVEERALDKSKCSDTESGKTPRAQPDTSGTEYYSADDLIVIGTQPEDHMDISPCTSPKHTTLPHALSSTSLTRSPIASYKSTTDQRSPIPYQRTPISSQRSPRAQSSSVTPQLAPKGQRSPSSRSSPSVPERAAGSASREHSAEARSPLRSSLSTDKDTSPTWLNSRLSTDSLKPSTKTTHKRKSPISAASPKSQNARKPKSAAARMMLEFQDATSEQDTDSSSDNGEKDEGSSKPSTKEKRKPKSAVSPKTQNTRKPKSAAARMMLEFQDATSERDTDSTVENDEGSSRPSTKDIQKRKSPNSTVSPKIRNARKPKSAAARLMVEFQSATSEHDTDSSSKNGAEDEESSSTKEKSKLPKSTVSPKTQNARKPKSAAARMMLELAADSSPENSDQRSASSKRKASFSPENGEDDFSKRRRTSLKGRGRNLSTSESEEEPQAKEGGGGSPGVIDLTEDTQISQSTSPRRTTSSTRHNATFTPTRLTRHRSTALTQHNTCPLCSKTFPPSVLEIHASQCNGVEDDTPSQNFRTKHPASKTKRSSGRMYQPTLHEIQRKEKQRATEIGETIESSDTEYSDVEVRRFSEMAENPLLEELTAGLESDASYDQSEDLRSESSTSQAAVEPRLIPSEDGGFIVDESTISNSPIRTFTKISDLAAKDRERFRNQFNKGRARAQNRGGRSSNGERSGAGAWSNDFGELAQSSSSTSGRGKRQGGRGGNRGGRRGKTFYKGGKKGRFMKRKPRN